MQVKTYTGRTLAAALARARSDLGADALVLGSRETRDEHGRAMTELTIGVERPQPEVDARAALKRLAQSVARRRAVARTISRGRNLDLV